MTPTRPSSLPRIPAGIWVLGFVSLLMDTSSEMIHSLLPLFMVGPLGAGAVAVGLLEGFAEATALFVRVFSGALSDWLGRRKGLTVAGYALAASTKPLFAVAPSIGVVAAARLADRAGKGLRGAPRDALVADIAPADVRGAAFGLRQSLDTVGALAGPLLAMVLMLMWRDDFRRVFWVACVPAVLAVVLLTTGVHEPGRGPRPLWRNPLTRNQLRRLSRAYWIVVGLGAALSLARFSEAFLVLRAGQAMPTALVPLVMVAMNVVYAVSAYPFGRLLDRGSPRAILLAGALTLAAADIVLATSPQWPVVLAGVSLWGLHLGLTQGVLAAMVSHAAPPDLRGTAFGMFNLVSGLALLAASAMAGALWASLGPAAAFLAGAALCMTTVVLLAVRPQLPSAE